MSVKTSGELLVEGLDFDELRRQQALTSHENRMNILFEAVFNPLISSATRLIEQGNIEGGFEAIEKFKKLSLEQITPE